MDRNHFTHLKPLIMRLPIYLTLMLLFSYSGSHVAHAQEIKLQPVFEGMAISESARGIWENPAYGWILQLSETGMILHHRTENKCLKDPAGAEDLAQLVRFYQAFDDRMIVSVRKEQSTQYQFFQLDALPAACNRTLSSSPTEVFDYFAEVMESHYAFFELYGVDWATRKNTFRSAISNSMTETELFGVLESMLEGLNDGHLELYGTVDGEDKSYSGSRPRVLAPALDAAFEAQQDIESKDEYSTQWFFGSLRRFRSHVLDQRGQGRAAGGNINWGRMGDIGYINVFGMGGFADEDSESIEDEIEAVHRIMDGVLEDLQDTKALIFDIALNQGGLDEVSLALASHFTNEKKLAYTKVAAGAASPPQPLYVLPTTGTRYLKPVVLFTSDITVSAAEIFTMAMRSLPSVTHMGDTTWGALSDILTKPLPNGWTLELSNEIYHDAEGVLWEGKGIPPVKTFTVFDPENLTQSHHNAILLIAKTLQRTVNN